MYTTEGHELLSKESILKRTSEFEIFRYYISGLKGPNTPFCSELRKDSTPTCRVSLLSKGWRYKDFGTGDSHDCFSYIQEKYHLNLLECLNIISVDLRLGLSNKEVIKPIGIIKDIILGKDTGEVEIKSTDIKIVQAVYTKRHLDYWADYYITQKMLEIYNIVPISSYYINNKIIYIPKDEIAFAYCFGDYKYKIMRPYNKEWKWINNASHVIQGLKQLPADGDVLFITSSLKDVVCLRMCGYQAIAPQSETTLIDSKLLKKLKKHFKKIILYYDSDEPGIAAAIEHAQQYKIKYIHNKIEDPKDPSDYIKKYGVNKYKEMLWQLIETGQQGIISREL